MQPHLLLFTLSLLLLLLHYRATASVLPSSSDDITSSNNRDFNSDNFINSSPETSQFEVADLLFDGPKPSIIDNVRGGLGAGARPALEILRQGLDIDNPGEIILPTEKKSDEPARTSGRKELASTDDFCPYHMFGLRKVAVCDSGKVLDVQFNLALKYWTLTAATLMCLWSLFLFFSFQILFNNHLWGWESS